MRLIAPTYLVKQGKGQRPLHSHIGRLGRIVQVWPVADTNVGLPPVADMLGIMNAHQILTGSSRGSTLSDLADAATKSLCLNPKQ